MSKPALKLVSATAKPRKQVTPQAVGVVSQVRTAFRRDNALATTCGAVLGGFVPAATFSVAHGELSASAPLWTQPLALLVLGGLVFSALTVAAWGRMAFKSPVKAVGFTVLIEGVMTFSHQTWLSCVALAYLVLINAIATGVTLSRQK